MSNWRRPRWIKKFTTLSLRFDDDRKISFLLCCFISFFLCPSPTTLNSIPILLPSSFIILRVYHFDYVCMCVCMRACVFTSYTAYFFWSVHSVASSIVFKTYRKICCKRALACVVRVRLCARLHLCVCVYFCLYFWVLVLRARAWIKHLGVHACVRATGSTCAQSYARRVYRRRWHRPPHRGKNWFIVQRPIDPGEDVPRVRAPAPRCPAAAAADIRHTRP